MSRIDLPVNSMYRKIGQNITVVLICFFGSASLAQQSVGLFLNTPESYNGYTLFAPIGSDTTFLIDNCGKSVHQWVSNYKPGMGAYLQQDAVLLRGGRTIGPYFNGGGKGGELERRDWQGNLIWNYFLTDSTQCLHHDFKPLPNGNILAIVWEKKSIAQSIAAGRNPQVVGNGIWSERIIELTPFGINGATVVWEWHAWDHLVQHFDSTLTNYYNVADHPELIDINYAATSQSDWLHINAIAYNPTLDQIILSVHQFGELWVIDHSTTTAEAATHTGGNTGAGGDLLYRWGNPAAYQMGTTLDQKLFGQHDAQWIADTLPHGGSIMCFNNGLGRPGNYSTIEIIQPPLLPGGTYQLNSGQPFGPAVTVRTWPSSPDTSFFGVNISGVQMQPNGNLLICEGPSGNFFEVDTLGTMVWKYINPVTVFGVLSQGTTPFQNTVFKIQRYAPGYTGFSGVTLTPGAPIELNPLPYVCTITTEIAEINNKEQLLRLFPNPVHSVMSIELPETNTFNVLTVTNALGAAVIKKTLQKGETKLAIDLNGLAAGVYTVTAKGNTTLFSSFVKLP